MVKSFNDVLHYNHNGRMAYIVRLPLFVLRAQCVALSDKLEPCSWAIISRPKITVSSRKSHSKGASSAQYEEGKKKESKNGILSPAHTSQRHNVFFKGPNRMTRASGNH